MYKKMQTCVPAAAAAVAKPRWYMILQILLLPSIEIFDSYNHGGVTELSSTAVNNNLTSQLY